MFFYTYVFLILCVFSAITEEINSKIVETYISIPGLEVKWKIPGIGTAELKNNCSVTPTFNTEYVLKRWFYIKSHEIFVNYASMK